MTLFGRHSWRVAFLLLASGGAWAQKPPLRPKARLDDCYRIVGRDSVVFFYTPNYVLTPPGCATIRRHARLDSAGRFFGYVRDYRLANNQLLLQGAYRNGQLEGLLELYHDTGELAARGYYQHGLQVGDWAYWYASGKPRQVLSFRNGLEPLVQKFWDESGRQTVVAGNGTWFRVQAGLRLAGAVVAGAPDGRWKLQRVPDEGLVTRENFVQGRFRHGLNVETLESYQNTSRLSVADWEEYLRAEQYQLSPECP